MKTSVKVLLVLFFWILDSRCSANHPVLYSISPDSELSITDSFTLTARGSQFQEDSEIVFDGQPKSTCYISPSELTCTITSSDLAFTPLSSLIHKIPISVRTPDGGDSGSVDFTVYSYPDFLAPVKISDTYYPDVIAPFIDTDNNSNLYVIWPDVKPGEDVKLYFSSSQNNGATWSQPTVLKENPGNVSMAVQRSSGIIFIVSDEGSFISIIESSDSGKSWTPPSALTQPEGPRAYKPGIFIDSDGTIFIPYMSTNSGFDNALHVLKSTDNGATFGEIGRLDLVGSYFVSFGGANCKMRADKAGVLYAMFHYSVNEIYDTHEVSSSLDGGLNWSEPKDLHIILPAMAVDHENGVNVIGAYEMVPSNYVLRFKRSTDKGVTWTSFDFADTGYAVSDIWANSLGSTDVIWNNQFRRSFDHGATWKAAIDYTLLSTYNSPSFVEDGSGRISIAWVMVGGIYFTGSRR
jgi:hypothetical protein